MADILIYTVGDRVHGMGHVVRCLALADALVSLGHTVMFATQHETAGFDRIRRSSYRVVDYAPDDLTWVMRSTRYQACIVDVENGPDRIMLNAARRFSKVVVIGGSGYVMKDREAIREIADLFIAQTLLPNDADVTGAEHIIIRPEYAQCKPSPDGHILISMGGGDPHSMTHRVLSLMEGIGRKLVVINGQASEAIEISEANDSILFVHAPDSLAAYMNGAALFIGALGMSAFEAAAAGVPALLTAWSADHEDATKALASGDVAINLGTWDKLDDGELRQAALDVIGHEARWLAMSVSGKTMVDGKGAARVANCIARLIAGDSVMVIEPHAERIIHAEATVRANRKGGKREKP